MIHHASNMHDDKRAFHFRPSPKEKKKTDRGGKGKVLFRDRCYEKLTA
jgi:hypothetical protein